MTRPAPRPLPWLVATFLGLYGLFAGGHLYTGDAATVQATARSVLSGQGFAIDFDRAYGGAYGPDGKFYGQYGLGAVLSGLVPAAAGELLAGLLPGGPESTRLLRQLPAALWNIPFAAAAVGLVFACAGLLGMRPTTALAVACSAGVGTMLWPYAARDFTEPQVACFLLLAYHELLRLERSGREGCAVSAGAALGWALLTKVYVVVLAPLFVFEAWRRGGGRPLRTAVLFSTPLGVAAAAIAWYNLHRFGSPFVTGYASQVQNTHIPFWIGAFGLLLSAGKSVFLYNPPLLAAAAGAPAFHRRAAGDSRFIWLLAAVHVAFFSIQQNWDGDWAWGPRYLLPAIPFTMLAAGALLESGARTLLWRLTLAAGLAVQFLGLAVDPNDWVRYLEAHKRELGDYLPGYPTKRYVPLHQHHWNPDLSPLRGHWFLLRSTLYPASAGSFVLHSSAEEWNDEKGHVLLPLVDLGPAGKHAGSLDFWFASLPRLMEPGQAAAPLSAMGIGCLALVCLGLPRLARSWRLLARAEATADAEART